MTEVKVASGSRGNTVETQVKQLLGKGWALGGDGSQLEKTFFFKTWAKSVVRLNAANSESSPLTYIGFYPSDRNPMQDQKSSSDNHSGMNHCIVPRSQADRRPAIRTSEDCMDDTQPFRTQ